MKRSGIYCFRNSVTGKRYVGQSVDLRSRKNFHLSALRRGDHNNPHLQSAFMRYGEAAFEYSVLEEVSAGMLDIRELAWIDYYQTTSPERGYNLCSGGNVNRTVSPETRERMSLAQKGRVFSPSHRARLSSAGKGRVFSQEHRDKLSDANKGKQLSDEHKKKLLVANLGRKRDEAFKARLAERNKARVWSDDSRKKASLSAKARWLKKGSADAN